MRAISKFYRDFNEHKAIFFACEEIVRLSCIRKQVVDGDLKLLVYIRSDLSLISQRLIQMGITTITAVEYLIMAEIVKHGPILFYPTKEQFDAMEDMSLTLTWEDYQQPFDTMIIELPDDYTDTKIVPCPQAGEASKADHRDILPQFHKPIYVMMTRDPEVNGIYVCVQFSSGQAIKTVIILRYGETVEEALAMSLCEKYMESIEQGTEEERANREVVRAVLNYCLLLDEAGIKKVGAQNPSHYDRLIKFKQKAQKSGDKQRQAKSAEDVRLHPIIYDMDREIELYQTQANDCQSPCQSTGRTVKPHRRRGYYKQQPYGEKGALRKRIRIKPVIVHKEAFVTTAATIYKS